MRVFNRVIIGLTIFLYYILSWNCGTKESITIPITDTTSTSGVSIDPKTMTGQLSTGYTWAASLTTTPSNVKYEWDFGDGTTKDTKQNDPIITHSYAKAGFYAIKLICYDGSNNKIGEATATAEIRSDIVVIFDNWNTSGVGNNPSNPTEFTTDKTYYVTFIQNYHWNNGTGVPPPGTIGFTKSGNSVGTWNVVKTTSGQGGVPNANWICYPNVTIQSGTYRVTDSSPITWSNNSLSGYAGFSKVMGYVK